MRARLRTPPLAVTLLATLALACTSPATTERATGPLTDGVVMLLDWADGSRPVIQSEQEFAQSPAEADLATVVTADGSVLVLRPTDLTPLPAHAGTFVIEGTGLVLVGALLVAGIFTVVVIRQAVREPGDLERAIAAGLQSSSTQVVEWAQRLQALLAEGTTARVADIRDSLNHWTTMSEAEVTLLREAYCSPTGLAVAAGLAALRLRLVVLVACDPRIVVPPSLVHPPENGPLEGVILFSFTASPPLLVVDGRAANFRQPQPGVFAQGVATLNKVRPEILLDWGPAGGFQQVYVTQR